MYKKTLIAITLFIVIKPIQLPLPFYNGKPIYHIKAHQIDKWSCCYNALFNACNIEQYVGISNTNSDYLQFCHVCEKHLSTISQSKSAACSNSLLEVLAKKLGLLNICFLILNDYNKVEPLLVKYKAITYPLPTPRAQIDLMLRESKDKQNKERIDELNRILSVNKSMVMHFFCQVRDVGEPHAVLISLVQNQNGRSMYIFDNLNSNINQYSHAKIFIDFVYSVFKVFLYQSRTQIQFPDFWPSYKPKNYYR